MKLLRALGLAAFLAFSSAGPTLAVETPVVTVQAPAPGQSAVIPEANAVVVTAPGTVVVPYGSWIDELLANSLGIVSTIIALLFTWAARKLPKVAVDLLMTLKAEQLLTRAADYGINVTRGAVKGKSLDLNVGNAAVAQAAQYAIDNGPKWLVEWLGGKEGIRDKMLARIPRDETVGSL